MTDVGNENMNFLSKGDGQQVNHHDYSSDSQAKTIDNAPDSHDVQRMVNQRHLSVHSSKSRSHEPRNDLNSPIATTLEPSTINLNISSQHSRAQNPKTHDSKADSKVSPVDQASMPFKLLSNKGEKKLKGKDPTAWKSYRQALTQRFPEKAKNKPGIKVKKRERKIQKLMNTTTAEVDEVLSRVGRWPLPPEKSSTTNKILMGETLYAREPKWSQNSQINFRYPPFLNDKGMPFKASEFSYREFIPIFLVENQDRIETITELDVAEAFRASIKVVFPHVYWAHQDMLSTCTMAAEHSFLDEAKAQVKMSLALKNHTTSSSTSMENINARVRMALSSSSMENTKNQAKFSSAMEKPASLSSTSTEDENQQIQRESLQKVSTEQRIKGARLVSSQVFDHSELPGMDKGAEIPKIETLDQNDPISMDVEAELSEKETLIRYFPNLQSWKDAPCLGCAKTGHCWSDCPSLSCTQCGGNHSCNSCPMTRRCNRCRELGHSIAECPEKLTLPKSQILCDLCRCIGHVESACHHIWRTFQPNPQEILKVQSINAYCYCCGASGHYGSECGLNRYQGVSAATTWSRANLNMYIDPSSSNRALSTSVDLSLPVRKGFNIKGKASNPVASDEESEAGKSFIRPKVRKFDQGTIRFGSVMNNSHGSSSGREHDARIAQKDVFNHEPNLPRGPRLQSTFAAPERTIERQFNQYAQVREESLLPKIPPSRVKAPHSAKKVLKTKKTSTKKSGRHERVGKKGSK